MAAAQGNIKPLRALYSQIAQYIHLPRRQRRPTLAKRFIKAGTLGAEDVAEFVPIVYSIWKANYNMKLRYRRDGQSTAADVAVEFYDRRLRKGGPRIDVGDVEKI